MTKKSDLLARTVSRIDQKYLSTGSFIYIRNPILMLRGFVFDMPPGGCYLWKYYLPLFGEIEFLHMSLGYRIEDGYIETKGKSISDISEEALKIINRNFDFSENENLDDLISFSRNNTISQAERTNLLREIECFQNESLEDILQRVAVNREKVGIAG
jgi:hypothetical protein